VPDRHHWAVRRWSGSLRCESWGCPDAATFEAIYVYQHEGEALATRKVKRLCHRHAQGWARQYHVEWTYGESVYPAPVDPLSRDADIESPTRQPRRPLIWSRRPLPLPGQTWPRPTLLVNSKTCGETG
jgi:hypothetical protein